MLRPRPRPPPLRGPLLLLLPSLLQENHPEDGEDRRGLPVIPSSYAVSILSTYTVSAHCQHIIYLHNIYTRGIQDRNRGLRGLGDIQVLLCLQVREVSASGHEEGALAGFFIPQTLFIIY